MKKYFIWSLGAHSLLWIAGAMVFMQENLFTSSKEQITSTYIYHPSSPVTNISSRSGFIKQVTENKGTRIHNSEKTHKSIKTQVANDNLLLKRLHELISEKQSYPEEAALLKQTGTVGIGFYLHPNGGVTETRVIHSSGNASLDQAALNAVERASPVAFAHEYLSKVTFLTVEVQFTLE